ncbi:MAG TPA: hypothetical protein VIH27_05635, partial [Nitrososphaerales archaeon]
EETSPKILSEPPHIPPPSTIIGAHPFERVDQHLTPILFNAFNRGSIGLVRILASPVKTEYPFGARADTLVIRRSVVPEFSTFTTLSGTLRGNPLLISRGFFSTTSAPNDLHASIVALVSRESRGRLIFDTPKLRLARTIARCV